MSKTISLRFNNTTTTLISDEDGMFNLNTLHKASGYGSNMQPSYWKRNNATKEFLTLQNRRLKSVNGGTNRGTYADEQTVYHYASWVSPEFHAAVIEAFTALANNNVKKAKEIVRTAVRVEGIDTRKTFAGYVVKHGGKEAIRETSDTVNLHLFGKTAQGIRATRKEGFNKSTPTRDRLNDSELMALNAVESLVSLRVRKDEQEEGFGRSNVRQIVNDVCTTVRAMIN